MNTKQIAEQYVYGLKLREEIHQLSNKSLSKKFERSPKTIGKVVSGLPNSVPAHEQQLIRDCASECDRLKSEYSQYTMPRLCRQHHVTYATVESELIRMGVWEVVA